MELTAIPAPPFGEGPRGARMAELLGEVGMENVRQDDAGNVLADLPGVGGRPGGEDSASLRPFILSAHLDTVFPAGTDVRPHREEGRLRAPGIADDGRGLAALLALGRVMVAEGLAPRFPLSLVATVGEEGAGNLRGVRHLFGPRGEGTQARGFISLDGVGLDTVTHRGVGSTRLRAIVSGPGGHSWTDWGRSNPIHALARAVARVQALELPTSPRCTLTVARWGGGTSINAIPQWAWTELDLRGEEAGELSSLEGEVARIYAEEASADGLSLEVEEMGRRPPGVTAVSSPLVQAALEATLALGERPTLALASTDANVPMSLGIPAITLGAGGAGGGTHTLDEWYSNDKGPEGILRALLTLLLLR